MIYELHRYAGRGLFLDPPTVFMCNSIWNLSLPDWFHSESVEHENRSKWTCSLSLSPPSPQVTSSLFLWSIVILCCAFRYNFWQIFQFIWNFTAFSSCEDIFNKHRDKSDLAGIYSSYISQKLSQNPGLKGFHHIGALIIEPGEYILFHCFRRSFILSIIWFAK